MTEETKRKSVNVRRIFINARQQIGIYEVCAKYKISEKSAILLTLSKGLHAEGFMNEDDFKKDFENYGKPLTEKVEENKQQAEKLKETKSKAENVLLNNELIEKEQQLKNMPQGITKEEIEARKPIMQRIQEIREKLKE